MEHPTKCLQRKTKFTSYKQYLLSLHFNRNTMKTNSNQLIRLSPGKNKRSHKPWKVAAAKIFLSSFYVIGIGYFEKCVLFNVMIGRHMFYTKLSLPREFLQPASWCVLWNRCFEKSLNNINNILLLLIPKI